MGVVCNGFHHVVQPVTAEAIRFDRYSRIDGYGLAYEICGSVCPDNYCRKVSEGISFRQCQADPCGLS